MKVQVDTLSRELYLKFAPMDLDSDGTSRDIDTAVLHRISILFTWAELLGRRRRRRHLEIQVDIQARELYLEFVPMDLDSDETSRDIDTAVLHRISISFIWAERFGLGSHF